MIVDGVSLIEILKYKDLSEKFFKLGIICRSVICCRSTPKQKSEIVALAKRLGNWITLSIGDGANDVPMIMEAHIGVGIQGKEGTQAVRSADYALSQFKFLQRLLLVHGRNGYRRISAFICYYFYKNIILVFTEIYFVFFNGFSGQSFFSDFLPAMFNFCWTSWPCIFAFGFDKDIADDNYTFKNNLLGKYFEIMPSLYKAGQVGYYFNLKRFWGWLISAVLHGGTCFVLVIIGLENTSIFSNGNLLDHWFKSTIVFSLIIHIVTYKIFMEISYWNILVIGTCIFSVFLYYISIYWVSLPAIAYVMQNDLTAKVSIMLNSNVFILYIIVGPLLAISADIAIKFVYNIANPSPVVLLKNIEIKMTDNIIKRISTIRDADVVYSENHKKLKTNKTFNNLTEEK